MGISGNDSGCSQFVKYGMFLSNLIIFIGGAFVFVIGLITVKDRNFLSELLGTNLFSGAVYVLIVASAFVCLLSFFGCFGAIREIRFMLVTYFVILFMIFITMFIGGILGIVFREKVELTMKQEMHSSMRLYGIRYQVTEAWDTTQNRLKCCGVESFRDWYPKTPFTCCQEIDGISGHRKPCQSNPALSNVYPRGCYEVGLQFVKERAFIIGISGIVVAILLLFGMIFACIMCNMIE